MEHREDNLARKSDNNDSLEQYGRLALSIYQLKDALKLTPFRPELSPEQDQAWTYTLGPNEIESVVIPVEISQTMGRINSIAISGGVSPESGYGHIDMSIYDSNKVYMLNRDTIDSPTHEDTILVKEIITTKDGAQEVVYRTADSQPSTSIPDDAFYAMLLSTVIDEVELRMLGMNSLSLSPDLVPTLKELLQKKAFKDVEFEHYDFTTNPDIKVIFTDELGGFSKITIQFALPDGRIAYASHDTSLGLKVEFETLEETPLDDIFGGTTYTHYPLIPTPQEVAFLRQSIEHEAASIHEPTLALNSTDTRGSEDPSTYVKREGHDKAADYIISQELDNNL